MQVRGRLSAAGQSIPLDLDATLQRIGDELEVAASIDADHQGSLVPSPGGVVRVCLFWS